MPYEVVYALRLAMDEWGAKKYVITTALLDEQQYYFESVDPSKIIKQFLDDISFDVELIQIALPKLYRHHPLYNVALYHELGHFLDHTYSVIDYSILINELDLRTTEGVKKYNHRKEFFADLFAASYTGYGIYKFLSNIAPDAEDSSTHPATQKRLEIIDCFLQNKGNEFVDLFNECLNNLSKPKLEIRYIKPDVSTFFNNVRPCKINDDKELHGLMEAAWEFCEFAQSSTDAPWKDIGEFKIQKIINDLVERSIRNRLTSVKWNYGVTG